MTVQTSDADSLLLRGLDGSNPLAFLAALGTLRVLTTGWPEREVRMGWKECGSAWRPYLLISPPATREEVVEILDEKVAQFDAMFPKPLLVQTEELSPKNKKGEPKWRDKLRFPYQVFVTVFRTLVVATDSRDRCLLDFGAAWGADAVKEEVDKQTVVTRTQFDFTAGQQALIGMIRDLRTTSSQDDLDRCLFVTWLYPSGATSLRWDPMDEKRQYALQAIDPQDGNNNPIRSEPGANLLAVEGLPFFPLVPTVGGVSQTGFDRSSDSRSWTWPIWCYPVSIDVVRSLLTLPTSLEFDHERGIVQRYRSRIVQPSGSYRCFTPAEAV